MKSLLETGPSASAHDMKEKHIVDQVEPAVHSPLSKKDKTGIWKSVREMAYVCSVSDVDFRNLEEEHKFGAGKDMTRNVDLLLAVFFLQCTERSTSLSC